MSSHLMFILLALFSFIHLPVHSQDQSNSQPEPIKNDSLNPNTNINTKHNNHNNHVHNNNKNNTTSSITTRILFGSCSKPYYPQPLWSHIISRNPDLWIWTGDIVYLDRPNIPCSQAVIDYALNRSNYLQCHRIGLGPSNPAIHKEYFDMQLRHPDYQEFLQNKIPVIGIWDDHDYGHNNAGLEFKYKDQTKKLLLDFLKSSNDGNEKYYNMIGGDNEININKQEIQEREIRDGVYTLHTMKIPVGKKEVVIDVYLLDNRWFADNKGKTTLLGDEQWNWFENMIKKRANNVDLILIANGIQILPYYRGYYVETWSRVNQDRKRLLSILLKLGISKKTILLSGDVHYGEIMNLVCTKKKKDKNQNTHTPGVISDSNSKTTTVRRDTNYNDVSQKYYAIHEVTSSGMTHSWRRTYPKSVNLLKDIGQAWFQPDGVSIKSMGDYNFGEIEIEWDIDSNKNNNNNNIKELIIRVRNSDNKAELEEYLIHLHNDERIINISNNYLDIYEKYLEKGFDKISDEIDDEWICFGGKMPQTRLQSVENTIVILSLILIAASPLWLPFIVIGCCCLRYCFPRCCNCVFCIRRRVRVTSDNGDRKLGNLKRKRE